MFDLDFYRGKRVFVTGHTGFKGAWLCRILQKAGAELTGFALPPSTDPSLFSLLKVQNGMASVIGDVRDFDTLYAAFCRARPEIVLHLAAQPLVRESYREPKQTYETNVMGTVNLLECVRRTDCVRSLLNVTTDKVYQNREWEWGYRENEPLCGFDPYSNSKSCSELATHSYNGSFLAERGIAVSTARAGNVIGGGDFSPDRIIPDCIRAVLAGREIVIRNPHSTRPYQHVLEPIFAYLMIAARQYEAPLLAGSYNVGPDEADCLTTEQLVAIFATAWGDSARYVVRGDGGPHEASFLKLDCARIKHRFGWHPTLSITDAVRMTVEWTREWAERGDAAAVTDRQIEAFLAASAAHSIREREHEL